MSVPITETEGEIWNRLIQSETGGLSRAAAEAWLELKFSAVDRERVNELSAKAREGALSDREEQELDVYLNIGRALELIKAKARCSLDQKRSAA
ncbi:MAG: hypothetical protein AB9869_14085 [Verrucomicrobiia bacterium]